MTIFDIKRDNETEQPGGFFCQVCLTGKPLDDQSHDPQYCLSCFEFLLNEKKLTEPPKDYWSTDGYFFTHYGEKYGVTKNLGPACLGAVQAVQETPQDGAVQDGAVALPAASEVVLKIPGKENIHGIRPAKLKRVVLQHCDRANASERPQDKPEPVSGVLLQAHPRSPRKITGSSRRQKEKQGLLL